MPNLFWVHAFQTVVHLLNRRPTSTISGNVSPFFALFGRHPDYSSLKIFGRSCYPCLRPYNEHKFKPRSLPCVFLGYKQSYRGFLCYHVKTNKYFISRHFIFDELVFHYKFVELHHQKPSSRSDFSVYLDFLPISIPYGTPSISMQSQTPA